MLWFLFQMYLNFWANDLGIPILSVDYTLAPENYFPRQQEELFFAYCWALKNAHLLGKFIKCPLESIATLSADTSFYIAK